MKGITKLIVSLSLILNIYWLSIWIYVSNKYLTFTERVENFKSFFGNLSISVLNGGFLLLVILSIIGLHYYYLNGDSIIKNRRNTTVAASIIATIQYLFLVLLIWMNL